MIAGVYVFETNDIWKQHSWPRSTPLNDTAECDGEVCFSRPTDMGCVRLELDLLKNLRNSLPHVTLFAGRSRRGVAPV
jgi:hypothetical protein